MPSLPWPWSCVRGDRGQHGPRPRPDHSRARRGRVAAGVGWAEPARHSGEPEHRRRRAVADPAKENPRLDSVHRRHANGTRLRWRYARASPCCSGSTAGAQLPGYFHRRATLCHAYLHAFAECTDAQARGAVHASEPLCQLPRQAPEAGSACGDFCGYGHRRVVATVAARPGRRTTRHRGPGVSCSRQRARRHIEQRPGACRSESTGGARRQPPRRWRRHSSHAEPVGGKAPGRAAHRRGAAGAARSTVGTGPGLPVAWPQHAQLVLWRTAAAALGDPAQLAAVRCDLRAGRTFCRAAPR